MIKHVTNLQQALTVMHAAFDRYKEDPRPSSALEETIATFEQDVVNGIHIFGYYEEGELLGIVKCRVASTYGYFSRLSVLPQQQGRGIAKALIAYCEQFTKAEHVYTMRCKVRACETLNIALYERLQYRITNTEQLVNTNGDVIETVTMEKTLKEG